MSRLPGGTESGAARSAGRVVTFTSAASGVGRTSAVANVAWILAAAGKRVLVADWSTESATAHEFLAPFQAGVTAFSADVVQATLAMQEAGWGGRFSQFFSALVTQGATRYVLPEKLGAIDLVSHGRSPDAPHRPPAFPDDENAVASLRKALRSNYDYILVDGATGPEEPGITGMAWISDVIVSCFKVRQRAIREAARVARQIEDEAGRDIRFVVMPTQIDDRDPDRVARSRHTIHAEFATLLNSGALAEIPYHPEDAYDERLATLIDDPAEEGTLLRAYEALTEAVTHGQVRRLVPVSPAASERYRRAFDDDEGDRPAEKMFVAYATEDRPWADWLRDQLDIAGVGLAKLAPGGDPAGHTVLVVASGHPLAPPVQELVAAATRAGADLVTVRIAEHAATGENTTETVPEISPAQTVELYGRDERVARTILLSHFGLIAAPRTVARTRARYPGQGMPAEQSNIPTRNPSFVGREDDLEALRDALTATGAAGGGPYVLSGPPGVGKSEIAREYAHRFSYDYDVTWWVPAHSARAVHAGLGRLAPELRVTEPGDLTAAVLTTLADNAARDPGFRWLLIYDNADDFAAVESLLPRTGRGHVVVTTRTTGPRSVTGAAGVGAFDPAESVALLRRHAPQISWEDARAVAAAVDHLPFSLQLAGSWLRETAAWLRERGSSMWESLAWSAAEFVARLSRQRDERPAPGPYPESAAACLAVTFSALQEDPLGRLTIRLLEMCAFLSPQSVALWLLASRPAIEQLIAVAGDDGEPVHKDGLVLHQVLWSAARYGLAEVDWGRQATLRVHRMLQRIVRDGMDPQARRERQVAVLYALAGNMPTDGDSAVKDHQAIYGELQKHLIPSGALEEADPHVRHWVVNQIRFRYVSGDDRMRRQALEQAREVLRRWTDEFGPDDELRMQLMGQVANLQRVLGDREAALALDEELLSRQRRVLGASHPRTLRSGRGRGADLRAMGRFSEALAEDEATWSGLRDALGDDHPETIMAANSLALSAFLTGDHRFALSLQQETYARHQRLFGADHPANLWYACNLGVYLREMGSHEESRWRLTETIQRIRLEYPGRLHDKWRAQKNLAVTERRMGNPQSAQDRSSEAHRGYAQSLGAEHTDTLACGLSLAADLHAQRNSDEAVELGRTCLAGFLRTLGERHAFTHLCQVNLAVFMLYAGDVVGARELGETGWRGLRDGLGSQHPWTLAAAIDRAAGLAAGGDHEGALQLDEATVADCREFLGPDHPYTEIVVANLEGARRAARGVFLEAELFHRQYVDIDIPDT